VSQSVPVIFPMRHSEDAELTYRCQEL